MRCPYTGFFTVLTLGLLLTQSSAQEVESAGEQSPPTPHHEIDETNGASTEDEYDDDKELTDGSDDPTKDKKKNLIDRIELLSIYDRANLQDEFNGRDPVKLKMEEVQRRYGLRLFSPKSPLPLVLIDYRTEETISTKYDSDGRERTVENDHELKFGALYKISGIDYRNRSAEESRPLFDPGFIKIATYDEKALSAHGLYFMPGISRSYWKLGYEWSENKIDEDDRLHFAIGTLPYDEWLFKVGYSKRENGYRTAGGMIGRFMSNYFVSAGLHEVRDEKEVFSLLVGRFHDPKEKDQKDNDPTFRIAYGNNPDYYRTNIRFAFGRPGVPRRAFANEMGCSLSDAVFTDQLGSVLPIKARSWEETRVWRRTAEWSNPFDEGAIRHGGISVYFDDYKHTSGYHIWELRMDYVHDRVGTLVTPHAGPRVEYEKIPDVGRQDLRYGFEIGSYFGEFLTDSKFYHGGRVYAGVKVLSDFNEYSAINIEIAIMF